MRKHIVFDWDGTLFDPYVENSLYPNVPEVVAKLSGMADLSIVTAGDPVEQRLKIKQSGLKSFFKPTIVVREKSEKRSALAMFLPGAGIVDPSLLPRDVIVIGDRVEFEIAFGLEFGYTTVLILQGPHPFRRLERAYKKAHVEIGKIEELVALVKNGHC